MRKSRIQSLGMGFIMLLPGWHGYTVAVACVTIDTKLREKREIAVHAQFFRQQLSFDSGMMQSLPLLCNWLE